MPEVTRGEEVGFLKKTMEDNVTKIHNLVLADGQLKVREISETVGISKDRMGHILHEILGMRKLSVQWVLRLLTPGNKGNHETTSKQCLMLFKRNPKEFLHRFVTGTHQRPRNHTGQLDFCN